MPPWDLPANDTQSGYLSRSTRGGAAGPGLRDGAGDANAMRFDDRLGEEQLWIHAQLDQLTEVENDEEKWVGRDRKKDIDRDETNTIGRDRKETVVGNETITVKGSRAETVGKGEIVGITGSQTITVSSTQSLTVAKNISMQSTDGEIMIDAATKITLRVKDSTIVITESDITLTSKLIKLNP
jgi:type VI secretion system secreted protein VgrG